MKIPIFPQIIGYCLKQFCTCAWVRACTHTYRHTRKYLFNSEFYQQILLQCLKYNFSPFTGIRKQPTCNLWQFRSMQRNKGGPDEAMCYVQLLLLLWVVVVLTVSFALGFSACFQNPLSLCYSTYWSLSTKCEEISNRNRTHLESLTKEKCICCI